MGLKRRIVPVTDMEDERLLKTSLLYEEEQVERSGSKSPQISWSDVFNLKHRPNFNDLISSLIKLYKSILGKIVDYLTARFPQLFPIPVLSYVQSQRLNQLKSEILVPFDYEDLSHVASLRTLWISAFQDTPCPSGVPVRSPVWKDMGWQGEDPATDFRGGGVFGLRNLLFLARRRPSLFAELMGKTRGKRSAWEYPFAVGGINLTYGLQEMLGLRKNATTEAIFRNRAARHFVNLLTKDESAFDELFCLSYDLLDRRWIEAEVDYMGFNQVLKAVVAEVEEALGGLSGGAEATFEELRATLGLPPHAQGLVWEDGEGGAAY